MKKDNLLLIIDAQNDFCQPNGSLYVQGAENDTQRLANFIKENTEYLDQIALTQDLHQVIDISHPAFWKDKMGNLPDPFTILKYEDLEQGTWIPRFSEKEALEYIKNLEIQGEFPHVIWPEHCIAGSWGSAITDEIMDAVKDWARKGHYFRIYQKGMNPLTEHFGALRANLPIQEDPNTLINKDLKDTLINATQVLIAGQAKSHCVANTIKQMNELEGIIQKTVFLEDTSSNVTGFETLADPIYAHAIKSGLTISTTTTFKF
jgi:nicotinamidase/pyrazinamidase